MKLQSLIATSLFLASGAWASDLSYLDGKLECTLSNLDTFEMDEPTLSVDLDTIQCSGEPGCVSGFTGSIDGVLGDFKIVAHASGTSVYNVSLKHQPTGLKANYNSHPVPYTMMNKLYLESPRDNLNYLLTCSIN